MNVLVLPDVQAKPGNDFTFLKRIGTFIVKKKPDVIVCIGDFADMESLSSYDKGKKSFEGRRVSLDFQAAHEAMDALLGPLWDYNKQMRKTGHKQYKPRMVMCLGNHEDRISRAVNEDAKLEGLLSLDMLGYKERGWEVYPFLEVVTIGGVAFSHYFQTGVMGRPAASAQLQLNKKHMSCVAGHQQGLQMATGFTAEGAMLTSIIAGSCLHPSHKVLTADLQYVPLSTLSVGDKLVSFDEGSTDQPTGNRKDRRRFKTGIVTNLRTMRGEMFDVTLSGGKTFRVTEDHLWFTKNTGSLYSWKKTNQLRVNQGGRGGTKVIRLLDEFEHDKSWESGWLAGMYCGEGSLYHRKTTGGSCMQLSLSQSETHNPETCRRIESALQEVCGVDVTRDKAESRTTSQYRIQGGATKIAKVLGTVRPPRMLDKFKPEMLGSLTGKTGYELEHIVLITPVGIDDYIQIEIDSKTMVVEGYGHHNCYEHDEDYMGTQGNKHWRGFVMLYGVEQGQFDAGYISLGYVNEKFKGVV
jgi:hypothetical protein